MILSWVRKNASASAYTEAFESPGYKDPEYPTYDELDARRRLVSVNVEYSSECKQCGGHKDGPRCRYCGVMNGTGY